PIKIFLLPFYPFSMYGSVSMGVYHKMGNNYMLPPMKPRGVRIFAIAPIKRNSTTYSLAI
ncbi:TPA: hypothetical protein ACPJGZ_000549, partial [Haemophilus influenzae]